MRVAVYRMPGGRSSVVCEAIAAGINHHGDEALILDSHHPSHVRQFDVSLHYGLRGHIPETRRRFIEAGKHDILIDLGYWGRSEGGRFAGYHRLAIDALHATSRQLIERPDDRLSRFGLPPLGEMRREGEHILVAGMSEKSAGVYGLGPQQWEAQVIANLRRAIDRDVWYRPKPSWPDATKIPGSIWASPEMPLEDALRDCHVVVTHHSNVAIDALLAGVPSLVVDGPVRALYRKRLDVESVMRPPRPTIAERQRFLASLAYCQFNVSEMRDGTAWRHAREVIG